MKIINKFLLCALLLLPNFSFADLVTDTFWGLGSYGTLTGLNFELSGDKGGAWLLVGSHGGTTSLFEPDRVTAMFGYRRYFAGDQNKSNFFGGLVMGDAYGTGSGPRLGVGGEMGYQWLKQYVRATFSGGVLILEEIPEGTKADNGGERTVHEMEPQMLFSFSLSLRR